MHAHDTSERTATVVDLPLMFGQCFWLNVNHGHATFSCGNQHTMFVDMHTAMLSQFWFSGHVQRALQTVASWFILLTY